MAMIQNISVVFMFLIFNLDSALLVGDNTSCSMKTLFGSCGDNEVCIQKQPDDDNGTCQCLPGYDRLAGKCAVDPTVSTVVPVPAYTSVQPPTAEPHTGSQSKNAVVAGVLVPILLISAVVAALIYLGRRHGWMHRLRQLRPQQRRTNDVLIGRPDDDDEPIA